ncbi:hypothetical protein IEO21_11110 [Rhodonia placenta]|uniref:Uncharacterized protein n=1 Tax=Rhodonia placenta TaxID=104341 RepID=A0A8H7TVG7_9APHY|nr:hypothetical protein IEO21_11110 [Postia placenta]
MRAVGPSVM